MSVLEPGFAAPHPDVAAGRVPFVDLGRIHAPLREEILADIGDLIDTGAFANGPAVAAFEEELAAYCGTSDAIGVASGLDALRLALIALGTGLGDEVLVPANTFIATVEAVAQAGALPVLVDVSEHDYNIDVAAAESAVTRYTRTLLPVHLYGQLADMNALGALAARHHLQVLEDACQAHGATRGGVRPGEQSNAAAFSFYPGKNLGAMGDGGALVTDDDALAGRMRALREHGQTAKYHHDVSGFTSRLDTMQALVLHHKLAHLDEWNETRRAAAAYYTHELADAGDLVLPPVPHGSEPVWHLYVVQTEDPVGLGTFLAERGVATGRHYPQPPHLSPAFAWLGYPAGRFPVTERLAAHCLSLPIFAGITEPELERVVEQVHAYFDRV